MINGEISSVEALRELYAFPKGRTKEKVLASLEKHSRNFIQKTPFVLISTVNSEGKMDVSPRGGSPGFVHILDDSTLLLPDFKGNNRLDSLTNVIETGRIGMLFLLPGIDETLRINGSAKVSVSDDYLSKFADAPKPPISCLVISIEELFLHCAKALMRSKLWDADSQINPNDFPTMGQMLKDQLKSEDPAESREAMIQRYKKDL